ncbi:MAG: hydrolase 1, exosortase A system-associated [Gammaproteobacteria bacterium]
MKYDEQPVTFGCSGEWLVGIVARPARPAEIGVLVIVGGPQYRVGSHRQFMHLSRSLAVDGIACMRFDYRGMGDASGDVRTFEEVSEDIRAAVDRFLADLPTVKRVVLWGLCDGASAACLYAASDPRVAGIALLNPWVRTTAGEATAYLRHYYWRRLFSAAFWKKLGGGDVRLTEAARGLFRFLNRAGAGSTDSSLPERMLDGLARFEGAVLIVLSEADLVAAEFKDLAASAAWRRVLDAGRTKWREVAGATHTFSSEAWRREVAQATAEWVRALPAHREAQRVTR